MSGSADQLTICIVLFLVCGTHAGSAVSSGPPLFNPDPGPPLFNPDPGPPLFNPDHVVVNITPEVNFNGSVFPLLSAVDPGKVQSYTLVPDQPGFRVEETRLADSSTSISLRLLGRLESDRTYEMTILAVDSGPLHRPDPWTSRSASSLPRRMTAEERWCSPTTLTMSPWTEGHGRSEVY